jgi:hypothetical protein
MSGFNSDDLKNVILVHSQFLSANSSLNKSQQTVAEKLQASQDNQLTNLLLALLAEQRSLAEDTFNKVLSMPQVDKAIATLTSRTSALKRVADQMPTTTKIIQQGNKVVAAAKQISAFANNLG